MKFVNTKRLSPVIYEGDLPHKYDLFHRPFKQVPESEKELTKYCQKYGVVNDDAWWDIQKDRCINGYTAKDILRNGGECFVDGRDVIRRANGDRYLPDLDLTISGDDLHISGRQYFYLNFWKIKRLDKKTGRKKVLPPAFTDLSFENWSLRERRLKLMKHMTWFKRRQVGLTEESACDVAYDFLFFDDSQSVIVAGMEFYSKQTMNNVRRGLDNLKNTQFYKTLELDSVDYVKSKNTDSEIYMRTAKDNPQVVSSLTPSKVIFEEVGKWKKGLVIETKEFIEASIEAEGQRTGIFDFIGTAGEEMKDSVEDMTKLFYESESYGVLSFLNKYDSEVSKEDRVGYFIPAHKFELLDDDYNSLMSLSAEKINKERAMKKGKSKFIFIAMKPFTPSEMFQTSSGGYFGPEIVGYLNERYAYINSHLSEQKTRIGVLSWKDPNDMLAGVTFTDDPDGWCEILEEPMCDKEGNPYENLYCMGTDSYDQDQAETSTSKGCSVVKKKFLDLNTTYNLYTGFILTRPTVEEGGAKLFFERSAMGSIYFNNAKNNIEYSNLRIFDWYEDHGLQFLLKERPQLAFSGMIKNSQVSNRFGTDKSLKPHALAILKDQLTYEFIQTMHFRLQIKAFAQFKYDPSGKKYNCDITMASAECEVCAKDEQNYIVKKKEDVNEKKHMHVYKRINGKLQQVMV